MSDKLIIGLIMTQIESERQMCEAYEGVDWVEYFQHKYAYAMLNALLNTYKKERENEYSTY